MLASPKSLTKSATRAASRLDFHLRLLRWFEHYLLGPGGEPPRRELDYKAALGR